MRVDLHVHSSESDGTMTPTEIVVHAKESGLKAIAITDHDTVAGLIEAIQAGVLHQMEVIPGIEVSADFNGTVLHILGYYIDPGNLDLIEKLKSLRDSRKIRNTRVLQKLSEAGIEIAFEYDLSNATSSHLAVALYEGGYATTVDDAYNKFLAEGRLGYVKLEPPNMIECIELIHSAGGLAILAHPMEYGLSITKMESLIGILVKYGLDGIEALYSEHSLKEELLLKALAKRYSIVISGGSDFHGSNRQNIGIGVGRGDLKVPYSLLEVIKARVVTVS